MKYFVNIVFFLVASLSLSSCLESGLDELPAYEDAEITSFKFEYRWYSKEGAGKMVVTQMTVATTIDSKAATVDCVVTVPAASTTLPDSERAKVSLNNLVGYCELSTAAMIKPIGDAPELGKISDFSGNDMQYEVTAANGNTKVWTLNITSFNK